MTRLSFRAWQLGPHETVTDEALAGLVGQTFTANVPGSIFVGTVLTAHVDDDRWIILATDIDLAEATKLRILGDIGGDYSLREVATSPELSSFSPRPPDWQSVENWLGPARLERTLDLGLARAAAGRWWFDRMADSNQEWPAGPEFQLHWLSH